MPTLVFPISTMQGTLPGRARPIRYRRARTMKYNPGNEARACGICATRTSNPDPPYCDGFSRRIIEDTILLSAYTVWNRLQDSRVGEYENILPTDGDQGKKEKRRPRKRLVFPWRVHACMGVCVIDFGVCPFHPAAFPHWSIGGEWV